MKGKKRVLNRSVRTRLHKESNRRRFLLAAGVAVVLLFLILKFSVRHDQSPSASINSTVENLLQKCLEDSVTEATDVISRQGGSLNSDLSVEYASSSDGEPSTIAYLCYSPGYYLPCVIQEPMLLRHLEDELESALSEDVKACLESTDEILDGESAEVRDFHVRLEQNRIKLEVSPDLNLSFESTLHDLAFVAQDIVEKTALNCNFDGKTYMRLRPLVDIEPIEADKLTDIYILTHTRSNKTFVFATRSCSLLPMS